MRDDRTPAPHWRSWATLGWGLLIALVFVLVQTVVTVAVVMVLEPSVDPLTAGQNGTVLYAATFATTVTGCALIALIIRLKKGAWISDYLALREVSAQAMVKWLALLGVLILVTDLLAIAFGRPVVPEFMINVYTSAQPVWPLWIALIVAAPIFEEVFFRGFLFRGFAAGPLRPAGAVIITSAIWAASHLQYGHFELGAVFVLGLLLGAARARTGSLLTPIALHATANLIATLDTSMVV